MSFFPKNTIKQIKPGKTNQAEVFYNSIEQAEKQHPNCIEYISLRVDYIMLDWIGLYWIEFDYYTRLYWIGKGMHKHLPSLYILVEKNYKLLVIPKTRRALYNVCQIFFANGRGHGFVPWWDLLQKLFS